MKTNKQIKSKKNNRNQIIKQIKRNKGLMILTNTIQTGNKSVKKVKMITVNQTGNKKTNIIRTKTKRTARGRNQRHVNPVKIV
jgi:hypothetical protein